MVSDGWSEVGFAFLGMILYAIGGLECSVDTGRHDPSVRAKEFFARTAVTRDFLKVTATLSPEVYRLLPDEMTRRKLAKEPNAQLAAIRRDGGGGVSCGCGGMINET